MTGTRPDLGDPLAVHPEYTSRQNLFAGRHGWLRITPSYSVNLVEKLLDSFPSAKTVLDPFSGAGTTALCAAGRGLNSLNFEINPFFVWLARCKVATYTKSGIARAETEGLSLAKRMSTGSWELAPVPPIHAVERWWGEEQLGHLRKLKAGIINLDMPIPLKNLFSVAFCRAVIEQAKVTRGHQSLSFSEEEQAQLGFDFSPDVFFVELEHVLRSAKTNPKRSAKIIYGDARDLSVIGTDKVDLVVTSPPYPNRFTYIRETRPFLYWLDFVTKPEQVSEIDWRAIGGTWGAATSRLKHWQPYDAVIVPKRVWSICKRIEEAPNPHASLMGKYVLRYFFDVAVHLKEVKRVLRPGGKMYYVVGNSSFYGHIVETEKIYAELFELFGFDDVEVTVLRKRSSNSALYEFVVAATSPK